jgi:hypothetical protein
MWLPRAKIKRKSLDVIYVGNDRIVCHHSHAAAILPQEPTLGGTMTQSLTPLGSLLLTIVLATLAIGLPIVLVLSIRFLWDRNMNLGYSKQFEKLIWQLHRIASALEHQMNLSFPAVQPGTEEPRDLAYLQQIVAEPNSSSMSAATPSAAAPTIREAYAQQPVTPAPAAQQAAASPPPQKVSPEAPARAGVNSMFDL